MLYMYAGEERDYCWATDLYSRDVGAAVVVHFSTTYVCVYFPSSRGSENKDINPRRAESEVQRHCISEISVNRPGTGECQGALCRGARRRSTLPLMVPLYFSLHPLHPRAELVRVLSAAGEATKGTLV